MNLAVALLKNFSLKGLGGHVESTLLTHGTSDGHTRADARPFLWQVQKGRYECCKPIFCSLLFGGIRTNGSGPFAMQTLRPQYRSVWAMAYVVWRLYDGTAASMPL